MRVNKVCTTYNLSIPKRLHKKFRECSTSALLVRIRLELGTGSGVSVENNVWDSNIPRLIVTIDKDSKYSYHGAMFAIRKVIDRNLAEV